MGGLSEHRSEDESVLLSRLSMLDRQKWIVLLAVIVVPLIALAVSSSQQRLYQASVTVLVNEQNPTAAALNLTAAAASPPDRYAATQAALARAGIVAQMAVKAAKVPGRRAGELLANSSVSVNPNADLLVFSVSDPVPGGRQEIGLRLRDAVQGLPAPARHPVAHGCAGRCAPEAECGRRLGRSHGSPLYRTLTDSYRESAVVADAAGSRPEHAGGRRRPALSRRCNRRPAATSSSASWSDWRWGSGWHSCARRSTRGSIRPRRCKRAWACPCSAIFPSRTAARATSIVAPPSGAGRARPAAARAAGHAVGTDRPQRRGVQDPQGESGHPPRLAGREVDHRHEHGARARASRRLPRISR